MAFLLGLVAPHALLMPSPARHAGPALKGRASAAPTMTAYGQQSCQQPDIGGIRSGEIGTPCSGPIEPPACTRDARRDHSSAKKVVHVFAATQAGSRLPMASMSMRAPRASPKSAG